MKKRVMKTLSVVCAIFLGAILCLGTFGGPALARQEISVGQAGDPGDGLDVAAGGGGVPQSGGEAISGESSYVRPVSLAVASRILLVPMFDGAVPRFIVIRVPAKLIGQAK
ncbi:MAG: hypothetical protein IPP62_03760 [bacterium]|nr:hypothetical protein [bacterium]